jgi:adenine-specific DNA methylase
MAVVSVKAGQQGRFYRLPTRADLDAIEKANTAVDEHVSNGRVPADILPLMSGVFNAPLYGHTTWASLFNSRQLLAMITFAELVSQVGGEIRKEGGDPGYADAVQTFLAFALSKQADLGNALCRWEPIAQCPRQLFGRQAIGMVWDYAEAVPLSQSSGSFEVIIDGIARTLEAMGNDWDAGEVTRASASQHPLPTDSAACVFTDPPYYNAVPYADLSDFFYIWLKRSIGKIHGELLVEPLTPKADEICEMSGWDPVRYPHKNSSWYETRMTMAMEECRRILAPDGIGIVVFAHKSTAGWEAQLQAMIGAGWVIVGSWPIDTENASRLRAQGSAALASSVHLVCRPREDRDGSLREGEIGDWRTVLVELPKRIHEWMPRLAEEGVVGADAIFACLGPALEIFSRYSRVEKASGEVVALREYLEQVWAAVSTEALSMIFRDADAAGLESDARFTAIVLWTLGTGATSGSSSAAEDDGDSDDEEDDDAPKGKASKGGFALEYDAARKIAQGLGVNLEQIDSVVEVKGDKARLLPVSERAASLFGKAEKAEAAAAKKRGKKVSQKKLFDTGDKESGGGRLVAGIPDGTGATPGATVLDRIHQSMLLFAGGRADALKRFIVEDGVGGDARFWKLAQALSALYPTGSEEKRWVDGVLARKKSFGF